MATSVYMNRMAMGLSVAVLATCSVSGDQLGQGVPRTWAEPTIADGGPVLPGPCDGKMCGESCDCGADSDFESCWGPKGTCTLDGRCMSLFDPGCECISPADCPVQSACHTCPSNDVACVNVECWAGRCQMPFPKCGPSPGYDPCAGIDACANSPCTLCDPAVPECVEPPGGRVCFLSLCTPQGGYCE